MVKTGHVNAAEMGRILGISRGTVSNLTTDGILPRADRGKYDVAETVQAYLKHKLARATAGDETTQNLTAERGRLAKLKADAAEREAMVQAGEFLRADDVRKAWLGIVVAIRSRMLLIPSRVAPRIVTKAPAEAQALLQKEIHAALAELSA